ncbi:MAG: cysteine desulfurase [Ruminococcus sp.]|nr:cysteine desulfurase [Ruminococcus sp.]MCM1382726.1 cysteine desulfurase [Muribaculaceae bacterium]MCM1479103.1 cysteine desulfurase [Muribaculaceae bacterium]
MVYLDNAATTKPCEPAVSAVFQNMVEDFGNPSSLHKLGITAEQSLTAARKAVAAALVCDPNCITFTSGATECNNMAIFGTAQNYGKRRKKIVVSAVEHPSVSEPIKYLEDKGDFEVVRVKPSRGGEIDPEIFLSAVDENTCLASCMLVNNETGAIQPVRRIFSQIKRDFPECVTHCDAVQGFLKMPIKSAETFADVIVVSGHKVHAVKGVGAMYIRKGIRIAPLLLGGGQEKNLRSGTESVPLIAGFGAAVRALLPTVGVAHENAEKISAYLLKKLAKLDYITVNSTAENTSPYITNFSIDGVRSEIMLHYLESREIYVSSGSACSKGAHSSVLTAMGVPDKLADTAVRVSVCRTTTMGEIDILVTALQEGYQKLAKTT